eukprot:scaffold3822_cov68-Phaeocystis_antarctica.AAC.2
MWWNDEGLKALSARVARAAPNHVTANAMRAIVLSGQERAWEAGPRSAVELMEAATHYERTAALCPAPAQKAALAGDADWCRSLAKPCHVGLPTLCPAFGIFCVEPTLMWCSVFQLAAREPSDFPPRSISPPCLAISTFDTQSLTRPILGLTISRLATP